MYGKPLRLKVGWWVLPVVALSVLALDQYTKSIVSAHLLVNESWAPIPALAGWFDIHYVTNTGGVFGLFQSGSKVLAVIAALVSGVILVYAGYLPDGQWLVRLSLGLQLGGAVGNLVDRVRLGHVVDWLDVHFWPVFNMADSAVICGVALLALLLLREDRLDRQRAQRLGRRGRTGEQVSSG